MKSAGTPIFTAAEALEQRQRQGRGPRGRPPQGVILCLARSLARPAARRYRGQPAGGFLGDFYLLKATQGRVALAADFGIGAPAAVALLEELVAFGARQFIALGLAGGLQTDLQAGDRIICTQAQRDEGTSAHYLALEPFAPAAPDLTRRLAAALTDAGQSAGAQYRLGASWTTDAPYREWAEDVLAYRQAGLLSVEMESAGLFAAGQALGVQVAAAFVVADALQETPAGPRWRLDYNPRPVQASLEMLLAAAVAALQAPEA